MDHSPVLEERHQCVVGIRIPAERLVKAFDVCVRGHDIYVNYCDSSTPEAHKSYHASGQSHTKIGGQYVTWNGGQPMKLSHTPPRFVRGRSNVFAIGWEISKLARSLPELKTRPEMTIETRSLPQEMILSIEVSLVGNKATERKTVVGFPIVGSHQFGSSVRVEIIAFVLTGGEESDLL